MKEIVTTQEFITLMALMLGYLLTVGALVIFLTRRTVWRVFAVLTAVEIGITLLYMLPKGTTFWSWFFDPNTELAGGATFSAMQLLAVALAAFVIVWRDKALVWWARGFWLFFGAVFTFLAFDEYFEIHEYYMYWRPAYIVFGGLMVALTSGFFLFVLRVHHRILLMILIGLAMIGLGGVGLEAVANQAIINTGDNAIYIDWFSCQGPRLVRCQLFTFAEEFLEMSGVTIVLVALLLYIHHRLDESTQRFNRRLILRVTIAGGLLLLLTLYGGSTLLALFGTQPMQADYLDGGLQLVRYTVSKDVARPGETLDVTVYTRANTFLNADYSLSLTLFSQPEVESFAQSDLQLGEWQLPSRAWLPGLLVRNRYTLQLPHDLPANRSYLLVARAWQEVWENGLNVGATDRSLFAADTLILTSLPVLGEAETPPSTALAQFDFADGFTLAGYTLPEQAAPGGTIVVTLWWSARADGSRDLTQFLHLINTADESFHTFDRRPFDERFPTKDWPGGMSAADTWEIALPDDLPPGRYRVQTGLYDPTTGERAAVTDANGQPVQDNSIILGELLVE